MYRDVEIGYYDCQDSESNPRRCRAPSISISLQAITLLGQPASTTPSSSCNLVKGQVGKKCLRVTAEDWALIPHHDAFCTSGYATPTPGGEEQKRRAKRDLDLLLKLKLRVQRKGLPRAVANSEIFLRVPLQSFALNTRRNSLKQERGASAVELRLSYTNRKALDVWL